MQIEQTLKPSLLSSVVYNSATTPAPSHKPDAPRGNPATTPAAQAESSNNPLPAGSPECRIATTIYQSVFEPVPASGESGRRISLVCPDADAGQNSLIYRLSYRPWEVVKRIIYWRMIGATRILAMITNSRISHDNLLPSNAR